MRRHIIKEFVELFRKNKNVYSKVASYRITLKRGNINVEALGAAYINTNTRHETEQIFEILISDLSRN